MTFQGLYSRVEPFILKLTGRLPLVSWQPILAQFNPRSLGQYPPKMDIEEIEAEADYKKLRFAGKHAFWFPKTASVREEMWSEYLSVFWDNPKNSHFYLSDGTVVKPGDIVLDCGCCEGTFTRQALERGAAKVICLEPNTQMVESLRRTFRTEIRDGTVLVQQVACGAFAGTASFGFDPENPACGLLGNLDQSQKVKVLPISELCKELGLLKIDFIKMDIEGAEIQALEGALEIIQACRPSLAICTYHREWDFACLSAMLIAAGYRKIAANGITSRLDSPAYRPVMLHAH